MDRLIETDAAPFRDSSAIGGDALRRAREARNLTIVDVARQIHLSTSQVRDLEQGRAESFHNAEVRRRLGGGTAIFSIYPETWSPIRRGPIPCCSCQGHRSGPGQQAPVTGAFPGC